MAKKVHKKRTKKVWKRVLKWGITFIGVMMLILIGYVGIVISQSPTVTDTALVGTFPSTIYDKHGNVVTKLGTNDRVLIVPDAIPAQLEEALLAIEDKRFYEHSGVDVIRIVGATLANLSSRSLSQGGSTITQQLIKLSVFSTAKSDQTINRKIQEAWLSSQLEGRYTKQQILALYMNKVYMANGIYGFGTAANYYFGKGAEELTIAQAATLAGMVQAPSTYDPYINPQAAQDRRDIVLAQMLQDQRITQEMYDEAVATNVSDSLVPQKQVNTTSDLTLDSYIQAVLSELSEKTDLDPYTEGLDIYTNLDMNVQKQLTTILDTENYVRWGDPNMQAASVVVDAKTGAVVAMSGGRNIQVQLGLNRAMSDARSVGSASKPIIDYGPAIEYLNYSTGRRMVDEPIEYTGGIPLYNWDFQYFGPTTLRTALAASRNTPALRTLREVGFDNALAFSQKLGISIMNDGKAGLVESNAIGFPASPLQLAAAYAAFSNGGTYYKPFTIRQIKTQFGEEASYVGEGSRAMKESTAFMITDVLKGVPNYYAQYAAISGIAHAGKSGTTNYTKEQYQAVTAGYPTNFAAPDSWYVGYTTDYVVSTWVGYDKPLEPGNYLNQNDSGNAQRVYAAMMSYLARQKLPSDWKMPSSVERYGMEYYVKGTRQQQQQYEYQTTTTTQTDEDEQADESDSSYGRTRTETSTRRRETTRETTQDEE